MVIQVTHRIWIVTVMEWAVSERMQRVGCKPAIHPLAIAALACLLSSACTSRKACWEPPKSSPETDSAFLQMLNSSDPSIQAAAYAQRAERCIDRLSSTYGRGRDAADVIAEAVVQECQSDLQLQAIREANPDYVDKYTDDLVSKAKRRSVILIVRDRAAKCI